MLGTTFGLTGYDGGQLEKIRQDGLHLDLDDMIAERNPRQRREPRGTGGGTAARCVVCADEYVGFDRFGREVDHLYKVKDRRFSFQDQRPTEADHCKPSSSSYLVGGPAARWYSYAASADHDRYTYDYDRASNRPYRENALASGRDELYGYDKVDRLVGFQRGELNANQDGITGTAVRAEDWDLDMTGNWPGYVQKNSGSTDLEQGRTYNSVNETTSITAATGTDWADPVHDRAGNMTTIPKPANLADGLTATYDGWNRLVEVKDDQTIIGRYDDDGLSRRIKSHIDSSAPSNPTGIDTYVH